MNFCVQKAQRDYDYECGYELGYLKAYEIS